MHNCLTHLVGSFRSANKCLLVLFYWQVLPKVIYLKNCHQVMVRLFLILQLEPKHMLSIALTLLKLNYINKLYAFSYLLDSQIYCNILVLYNSTLNDKHEKKNKAKVDIKRNKKLPL